MLLRFRLFFYRSVFYRVFCFLSAVTIYYLTAKVPEICMNLVFKITDNAYPAMVEIVSKEDGDKFKQVHQKVITDNGLLYKCCFLAGAYSGFLVY